MTPSSSIVDEVWSVERLQPYTRNARTHSDEQLKLIVDSIREFGFTNPLVVRGEDGTLAAGHGRLEAGIRLGMTEFPVRVVTGWTEAQFRAYVLADNQIAIRAGWNEDLLKLEIEALQELEFDLPVLGFDPEELGDILLGGAVEDGGDGPAEEDEDDNEDSREVCCPHCQKRFEIKLTAE